MCASYREDSCASANLLSRVVIQLLCNPPLVAYSGGYWHIFGPSGKSKGKTVIGITYEKLRKSTLESKTQQVPTARLPLGLDVAWQWVTVEAVLISMSPFVLFVKCRVLGYRPSRIRVATPRRPHESASTHLPSLSFSHGNGASSFYGTPLLPLIRQRTRE